MQHELLPPPDGVFNASAHELSALLDSSHVQYVQHCHERFLRTFFPLTDAEIRALEANGNSGTSSIVADDSYILN